MMETLETFLILRYLRYCSRGAAWAHTSSLAPSLLAGVVMDSAMLRVLQVHRNLATAACRDWSQWSQ